MSWQLFSKLRFYASVAVALVGLSAASTWLTAPATLAQQPVAQDTDDLTAAVKAEAAKKLAELQAQEAELKQSVGERHPKLQALRAEVAALKALAENKQLERLQVEAERAGQARAAEALRSALQGRQVFQTRLGLTREDGDIISENIVGNDQRVIVRRTAGGEMVQEIEALPSRRPVTAVLGSAASKQNKELQKAVERLKAADAKDEDKQTARQTIEKILSEQFDEDIKQREEQIAQLEKRLASLKEQINKRRDAKARLMELRIELLINESEGLGFPNAWQVATPNANTLAPATSAYQLFMPEPASALPVYRDPAPPRLFNVQPPVPPAAPAAPQ